MASKKLNVKPLADRIVVEPVEKEEMTASGIILPETAKEKPQEGNVLAVGPGKLQDDGTRRPVGVAVGNKILFGKYAGTEITVDGEELLVGFHLPLSTPHQASCFKRIMRPQGVALPILNCAVWLERENDTIKDARIAVGPGGGTPFRATQAEDVLRGQPLNEKTFESALEALLAQVQFRTSARRASADYRRHIVSGLFKDTLESAWRRTS